MHPLPQTAHALALLLAAAVACSLPRDPERTSEKIADRGLKVGVVPQAPWACVTPGGVPRGAEVELVEHLARAEGVAVHWVVGGETELMAGLDRFELDLVVGGITEDSPYADEVAFTRPYHTDDRGRAHVFAAPPGENAWIMRVERFLGEEEAGVSALVHRSAAACEE